MIDFPSHEIYIMDWGRRTRAIVGATGHGASAGGYFTRGLSPRTSMVKKTLIIAAAALAVVTLGVYAWFYGWFGEKPTPAKLEQRALTAPTESEREAAASELAGMGRRARDHLQRTYRQSESPKVRAASVLGLGAQRDYDSIDLLFEAAQDESPEVRRHAGVAIQKMLGVDMGFRANDPPAKRAAILKGMRKAYDEMKSSGMLDEWRGRMGRE